MDTLTCPDHGKVTPRLAWCRADGLHLGGRCPVCDLWLKWLPADTPSARGPGTHVEWVRVEALR